MAGWVIQYKRSWPGYSYSFQPVPKEGELPSAIKYTGSNFWAWSVEGVKEKALRQIKEIESINENYNQLRVNNG